MKKCLELFWMFFRIGLITFGGGYAMLPMLKREVVEKKQWTGEEELLDCFAIGQCTPGVIAVNVATYVGYKRKSVVGAIAATVGVVLPSFLIILAIAAFIRQFYDIKWVQHALAGIRVAVCGVVTVTIAGLVRKSSVDAFSIVVTVLSFAVVYFLKVEPVIAVLGAAAAGVAVSALRRYRAKKR